MGALEMDFCINRRNEENVPAKGGGVQQRLPGGRKARAASWAGICPQSVEVTVRSAGGSRGVHGRTGGAVLKEGSRVRLWGHHRESRFFL